MRRLWWVAAMAVLAGCASTPAPAPVEVEVATPRTDDTQRLRERARVVLANYDRAVGDAGLVVVGRQDSQVVGGLEPGNEHLKQTISAGRFEAAGALPAAPAEKGDVVWSTGRRLSLPLLAAPDALRLLATDDDCPGCVPVPVTGARFTTMRVPTTRGPATVPAWEFALKDTELRVLRMALDTGPEVRVDPPAGNPDDIPDGAVAEAAEVDGKRITVTLTGPREGADQPCGEDYIAEAVESDTAVAVLVRIIRHTGPIPTVPPGTEFGCTMAGHPRTATVTLKKPLDGRTVLEVQQGQPVGLR
ncbi:hypothetical protein OWR29_35475 [Actinoplanes sp. Pm04-4]|uniref:Lipoprotein n=1 Tax=Paractinoplanes pyxinae TaxID=2997416 RepID=A0ABT4BA04_9ACTN|nr:hypothetical protein [Actinoplanes pyxinae]MCY1143327.1 hypothetical protein [Actinoplanes pyxinae]